MSAGSRARAASVNQVWIVGSTIPSSPCCVDDRLALVPHVAEELGRVGATVAGAEAHEPVRVVEGQAEAGHAADRQADEVRALDLQRIPQAHDVADQVRQSIRPRRRLGAAVAAHVEAQRPVAGAKGLGLLLEQRRVASQASGRR